MERPGNFWTLQVLMGYTIQFLFNVNNTTFEWANVNRLYNKLRKLQSALELNSPVCYTVSLHVYVFASTDYQPQLYASSLRFTPCTHLSNCQSSWDRSKWLYRKQVCKAKTSYEGVRSIVGQPKIKYWK